MMRIASLYRGDVPCHRAATVTERSHVGCCKRTGQCSGKRRGSPDRSVYSPRKWQL